LPASVLRRTEDLLEMRPIEVLQGAETVIRGWRSAVLRQSERTVLLGSILLLSAVSVAMTFVLVQYFSADALSSLVDDPDDCAVTWYVRLGRHCFSDYGWAVGLGNLSNPWEANPPVFDPNGLQTINDYPAAGIALLRLFALLAGLLHAPSLGLLAYLLVLALAVLSPAVWAVRGARGLERVVVFVACGAAAVPAWTVIDRGNSVGFLAPIALGFLVALCRRRWGLVAIMVVLAALVKPQFAVLAVALFAARQWRLGAAAVIGVVITNFAAYLLWPQDFPETIVQSIHNVLAHGSSSVLTGVVNGVENVSFTWVLAIPNQFGALRPASTVVAGFLARSLIGYAVLIAIVVCVLALGRRMPPVMTGIVLLPTVSLFPTLTYHYYLVFALPIAALVARAPDAPPGVGIFDRLGERRRAVGICVSLAAALSISYIYMPLGNPYHATILLTTRALAPSVWLIACAVTIVSYARRPAPQLPEQESLALSVCRQRTMTQLLTRSPRQAAPNEPPAKIAPLAKT
jgi:hypothetical protein